MDREDVGQVSGELGRGHTKETGNRSFREFLSAWGEHMLVNGAARFLNLRCSIQ
jgi:hypothetical protein